MKSSLTHSVPFSYFSSLVHIWLTVSLLIASLPVLMAQSDTPLKALEPIVMIQADEMETVYIELDYDKEPSPSISKEEIRTYLVDANVSETDDTESTEAVEEEQTEAAFEIEPAASTFEIGKEADFEGLRVANIDPDGRVILMEDTIRPILYVRFQKIVTGYIDVKMYSDNGTLIMSEKARNMMWGTEVQLDYSDWSEGMHSLQIKLDNGTKWTKKIVKTAAAVSNF